MIRVQRIETTDPLYAQEVSLRTSVLLDPVGLSFAEYLEIAPCAEEACEHFVAVADHPSGPRVVGTATLYPPPEGASERFGKVQQVCVNKQRQGEGVGSKVMIAIEARAFAELGLPGLYCHAQLAAMPFYEKLGWAAGPDTFLEAGIEHKRMEIVAPKPDSVQPMLNEDEFYA